MNFYRRGMNHPVIIGSSIHVCMREQLSKSHLTVASPLKLTVFTQDHRLASGNYLKDGLVIWICGFFRLWFLQHERAKIIHVSLLRILIAIEFNIYKVILGIYILHLFAVRAGWVVPDDNQPDFSSTFTQGSDIQVSWTSIDSNAYNTTLSTVWVTAYDYQTTSFSQLLAGMIAPHKQSFFKLKSQNLLCSLTDDFAILQRT